MTGENVIWWLITFFHVILLFVLILHYLKWLTIWNLWQVAQVPILWELHRHNLGSPLFWAHYRLGFVIAHAIDIPLAYKAMNESLCTDIHAIGISFQVWLAAQAIVIVIAASYPGLWAPGEMTSNIIYLICQLLWIRILTRTEPIS